MAAFRHWVADLFEAIRSVKDLEFSPRPAPWSLLKTSDSVESRLRFAATRLGPLSGTSRKARVKLLALSVYWPLKATADAAANVVRHGPRVRAMSGIGCLRQWFDVMSFAHRWNYSPSTYYVYRFWDPEIRVRASSFLQVHELAMLQTYLNPHADARTLVSKAAFSEGCRYAGIPTPQVVAVLSPESEEWAGEAVLPRRDLFIKPVRGMQGMGCERWTYDEKTEDWSRKGEALEGVALLAHFRRLAASEEILVQHALSNHAEITRFNSGPLSTFRVMTFIDDSGRAALMAVTLKLARRGSDVDNIHAGGIACPVDPETGQLGPGIGRDPSDPPWLVHPDTRQSLSDARLTTHRDVINLALTAQETLDVPWTVGWDVAMTPEGPVLIEGNARWGADLFHAPHRTAMTASFTRMMLGRIDGVRREAAPLRPA